MLVRVFRNARIYTGDPAHPWAQSLAIVDGMVAGLDAVAEAWAAVPGARTEDVPGALVIPGLIDAHIHLMWYALSRRELQLRGLSRDAMLALVAAKTREVPPGTWITGRGWDQSLWDDSRFPTAAELDPVAPRHPVALIAKSGHAWVVNSAALRAAGIVAATPDPLHGRIGRRPDGTPNGMLFEHAVGLVGDIIPAPAFDEVVDALDVAQTHLLALGITGVHDVDANPAFADEMRYLFEEQGISNPDLDNEILTGFELGWRGRFWQGRLRAAAEVYFNMNRQWVGFSSDIRFRPPPFQMQIDLANSHLGYDNGKGGYNIVGIHGSLECTPFDGLSLFARGEWRHEWRVNRELDHPNQVTPWQAAAGATLRLPGDMIAHLAAVHVAARHDYVRNPRSSLLPNIWGRLPAETYLMASWRTALQLPAGRLELGLSVFNPFAGRIREKAGIIDEQGHNFGGELLGRLVMLTARLKL